MSTSFILSLSFFSSIIRRHALITYHCQPPLSHLLSEHHQYKLAHEGSSGDGLRIDSRRYVRASTAHIIAILITSAPILSVTVIYLLIWFQIYWAFQWACRNLLLLAELINFTHHYCDRHDHIIFIYLPDLHAPNSYTLLLLLLLSCLPSNLLQTISSRFKFNFSSIPSRNRTHPGENGTYCGTGHVRAHRMFKGSNTNGTAVRENYCSVLCVMTLLLDSTHTVVCVLGGERDRTVSTL